MVEKNKKNEKPFWNKEVIAAAKKVGEIIRKNENNESRVYSR